MNRTVGWSYPETIDEAVSLLEGGDWEAVAGGTSWHFRRPPEGVGFVDLTRLGLRGAELDGGWVKVGAVTTVEELRRDPVAKEHAAYLVEVGESLRPTQLRNAVTVGGNCVQVFGWSDFPVMALAAGARFAVIGREPLPAAEFFEGQPRKHLGNGLLTHVYFPALGPGRAAAFTKLAISKVDLALVTAAAWVEVRDGRLADVRAVVGAIRGLPTLVEPVTRELTGADPADPGLVERAAGLTQGFVNPVQDPRGSKDYRRKMAGVLVGRALAAALRRASSQGE